MNLNTDDYYSRILKFMLMISF